MAVYSRNDKTWIPVCDGMPEIGQNIVAQFPNKAQWVGRWNDSRSNLIAWHPEDFFSPEDIYPKGTS